jgi:hypothetical protein
LIARASSFKHLIHNDSPLTARFMLIQARRWIILVMFATTQSALDVAAGLAAPNLGNS